MNWLVFVPHCPCINFNLTIDIFVSSVFECETFVFQTGYSRPLFRHFESLVSEATVLPIAPQPLPNCYIAIFNPHFSFSVKIVAGIASGCLR